MSRIEVENPGLQFWDYSEQYQHITSEGHSKPPPSFGSPTLVWHLGIWHVTQADEKASQAEKTSRLIDAPLDGQQKEHDKNHEEFFQEIRDFLLHLQHKGRIKRQPLSPEDEDTGDFNIEELRFETLPLTNGQLLRNNKGAKLSHQFHFIQPQSLGFTLWWRDSDAEGNAVANERPESPDYPSKSCIRVRVQVQNHLDHVTLSFFIDVNNPYGSTQIYSNASTNNNPPGHRRTKIARCLKKIRDISQGQITGGFVELDRLPEKGVGENDAKELLEIADYLYEGIWTSFMASFGFQLRGQGAQGGTAENLVTLSNGHIFADFRGLVMAVDGISTPKQIERKQLADGLRNTAKAPAPTPGADVEVMERDANFGFGPAQKFDYENCEANTVLKSLSPFVRRMVPWADHRDFIGCGILEGKALYLAPLKSSGAFFGDEEAPSRNSEVPADHLPTEIEGRPVHKEGQPKNHAPIRYMIVTKGQPHREQIGRFVERMNSVNTMRLFVFKNLAIIKNAGVHIQVLGHELDGVLQYWGEARDKIETKHGANCALNNIDDEGNVINKNEPELNGSISRMLKAIRDFEVKLDDDRRQQNLQSIKSPLLQRLESERIRSLARLIKKVEKRLVILGAGLDDMGRGGAGRLLYIINRSNYYANEFERLWPTLHVVNIDGWISYNQFVDRGVKPVFNQISSIGQRLDSLRKRLQSTTEMIQTSALIIETEATRANTETLRQIASNVWYLTVPLTITASALLWKVLPEGGVIESVGKTVIFASTALFLLRMYLKSHKKPLFAENNDTDTP